MPEPFSCHSVGQGAASVIQCDPVLIGPEPDAEAPPAPQNQSVRPGEDQGARALVDQHTTTQSRALPRTEEVHVEDVPLAPIALECGSRVVGGALTLAGAAKLHPALAVVTAFKSGYDIGQCIAKELNQSRADASEALAFEQCRAKGGTPVSYIERTLTCAVPAKESTP